MFSSALEGVNVRDGGFDGVDMALAGVVRSHVLEGFRTFPAGITTRAPSEAKPFGLTPKRIQRGAEAKTAMRGR